MTDPTASGPNPSGCPDCGSVTCPKPAAKAAWEATPGFEDEAPRFALSETGKAFWIATQDCRTRPAVDWQAECARLTAQLKASDTAGDDLAKEYEQLIADIAEHLPAYRLGEEAEEANPREVIEYTGDEIKRLRVAVKLIGANWRATEDKLAAATEKLRRAWQELGLDEEHAIHGHGRSEDNALGEIIRGICDQRDAAQREVAAATARAGEAEKRLGWAISFDAGNGYEVLLAARLPLAPDDGEWAICDENDRGVQIDGRWRWPTADAAFAALRAGGGR